MSFLGRKLGFLRVFVVAATCALMGISSANAIYYQCNKGGSWTAVYDFFDDLCENTVNAAGNPFNHCEVHSVRTPQDIGCTAPAGKVFGGWQLIDKPYSYTSGTSNCVFTRDGESNWLFKPSDMIVVGGKVGKCNTVGGSGHNAGYSSIDGDEIREISPLSVLRAVWLDSGCTFGMDVSVQTNKTYSITIAAKMMSGSVISWGDGSYTSVTKSNNQPTTYSHTYTSGGAKRICLNGYAYREDAQTLTNSDLRNVFSATDPVIKFNNSLKGAMTGISGSLGAIFNSSWLRGFSCAAGDPTGVGALPSYKFLFGCSFVNNDCTAANLANSEIPDTLFIGNPIHKPHPDYSCSTSRHTDSGISLYKAVFGYTGVGGSIPAYLFGDDFERVAAYNSANYFTTDAWNEMFRDTFKETNLSSGGIPGTLFGGGTGVTDDRNIIGSSVFEGTFYNSGVVGQIPANLFEKVRKNDLIYSTNSNITVPTNNIFRQTFNGCSGLTGTIPSTLFPSGICSAGSFAYTFAWCSNLTGFIQPGTFEGCKSAMYYYPSGGEMTGIFLGASNLDTVCPLGTGNYSPYDEMKQMFWNPTSNTSSTSRVVSCIEDSHVYTVYLDKRNGSGGTSGPLYKYKTATNISPAVDGWALSDQGPWTLTSIVKPTQAGMTFWGYSPNPKTVTHNDSLYSTISEMVVDQNGQIVWPAGTWIYGTSPSTYDVTIGATWLMDCAPLDNIASCERKTVSGMASGLPMLTIRYETSCPAGYEIHNDGAYNPWCSPQGNTITLNSQDAGAVQAGTTTLYGVYGDAVYLDDGHERPMSSNDNGITKPIKTFTVNYDGNAGGDDVTMELTSANTSANMSFLGYYRAGSGSGEPQYIDANGFITSLGISAGTSSIPQQTWFARFSSSGTVTLPAATRPGYVLDGWYRDADGTQLVGVAGATYTITSNNATLYAKWSTRVYTITMDPGQADNAGDLLSTVYLSYGNGFYLNYSNGNLTNKIEQLGSGQMPTKRGYSFRGYYFDTSATGGGTRGGTMGNIQIVDRSGKFLDAQTRFTSGDAVITALFGAQIYEITLDHNDGTTPTESIWLKYGSSGGGFYNTSDGLTVNSNDRITSITPPTRTGYTFQKYVFYRNATNQGTRGDARPDAGATAVDLTTSSSGTLTTDYECTSDDVTAYAQWKPDVYSIDFDNGNGSGNIRTAYLKYANGLYRYNDNGEVSGTLYPMPIPTYTGYRFDGYYYTARTGRAGDSGSGQITTKVIDSNGYLINTTFTSDDAAVTAVWVPELFEVTLNDNGADLQNGAPNPVYLHYANGWYSDASGENSISQLTQIPMRAGYTFTGYWKAASGYFGTLGGGCTDCLSNVQIIDAEGNLLQGVLSFTQADTSVIAGWTPRVFEITLDDNGGSGGTPTTFYLNYGEGWYENELLNSRLSEIRIPSRQGYEFSGYYNQILADGASGRVGSVIRIVKANGDLETSAAAKTFTTHDTNIYAAWNPTCNAVELNPNTGTATNLRILYKRTGEKGWYSDSECTEAWTGYSDGDVRPVKSGYTFRGFYASIPLDANNNPENIVEADSTWSVSPWISYDGNPTLNGTYTIIDSDTTLYAAWARDCADSNICTLNVNTQGDVRYTVTCSSGYEGTGGVYNPTCDPLCNVVVLDDHTRGGSSDRTFYKYTNDVKWYSSKTNRTTCANEVASISAPTKTHATFTKYVLDGGIVGTGTPNVNFGTWKVYGDTTLVAHYECDENYFVGNNPDVIGACNPNVYTITLNDNGNNDIVSTGDGYLYEIFDDHWSLNNNGVPSVTSLSVAPSRGSGYRFLGYFMSRPLTLESSGLPGTVFVGPDLSIKPDPDLFDSSDTVYAGWARECVTNPTNATCSLSVDVNGAHPGTATYTTACTGEVNGVQHGYTPVQGTSGTYNPSCTANEITINWNENNNNGTPINNGQCVYDGTLTLPGAPLYSGHTFMYWKLASGSSSPYQSANATVANGCVYNNTGVYSGTSTAITAVWCETCVAGANAVCDSLSYDTTNEVCTYVTHCEDGYVPDTGTANTANPSCHANNFAITYKPGTGSGTNVTQSVAFQSEFTTHGYSLAPFTKSDSVLIGWKPNNNVLNNGSNMSMNAQYTYNVEANTDLTAVWNTCSCSTGPGVQSCTAQSPSVANNQCKFTVLCTNSDLQSTANYTCDGGRCTATCVAGHTITLNSNGATTNGTESIYTVESGENNSGVYRNASRTELMATNNYPITLPQRQYTVTYNLKGGTLEKGATSPVTVTYTFAGYFDSANGSNKYIAGTEDSNPGYITSSGISAGTGYTNDATWYAQWSIGSVFLPGARRAGYTFGGWYKDSTYETPANENNGAAGTSYTPVANVTLYAKWIQCSAGYYCPGNNTSTKCAIGSWSAAGASSCTACGEGMTTITTGGSSSTSCIACSNASNVSTWTTPVAWSANSVSNLCVISACQSGYSRTGNSPYVCTANTYTITLRNFNDTSTDATIYEKYATGWFSNSAATEPLAAASIPSRSGYTFRGYYTAKQDDIVANGGSGTRWITNADTDNLPPNNTFTANTNLYAAWARNCSAGTGANCSLSINNYGTAIYTTTCKAGYYNISGNGTYNPSCSPVTPGYYSAEGENGRTACPDGLVTRGYGLAADEVGDCGHVLHIGTYQLFLRSNRQTSPSVNFKMGDNVFYADMYSYTSGGIIDGRLKMSYGDGTYVACDQTGDMCTIMGSGI